MALSAPKAGKKKPLKKPPLARSELIIITGMSGAGKATVLKVFEDLGYYSVDNLPIDLMPKFAELVRDSATIHRAAIVIDIREGAGLRRFPEIFSRIKRSVTTH